MRLVIELSDHEIMVCCIQHFFLLVFFMQSLGMLSSLVGVYQSGLGLVEDRAAASDFVSY